MKILVDADLALEALMNRSRTGVNTRELLNIKNPLIQLYLTDLGWQKIYAYTSRFRNDRINEVVINLLQSKFHICSVDTRILQAALFLPHIKFESAVEIACMNQQKLDAIVTHEPEDFSGISTQIQIWSLGDLLTRANLETQLKFGCISNIDLG